MKTIEVELQNWRGYSAYEVAERNGFKGTEEEWLESLKGRDGGVATINGKTHDENGNVVLTGEDIMIGGEGESGTKTIAQMAQDVEKLSGALEVEGDAIDLGGRYIDNARFR